MTAFRLFDDLSIKTRRSEVFRRIPMACKNFVIHENAYKPPTKKNLEKSRCLLLWKITRTFNQANFSVLKLDIETSTIDFVSAISRMK